MTVTVTVSADRWAHPPRVLVEVEDTSTPTGAVEVVRETRDGDTTPVLTAAGEPSLSAGRWPTFDYAAPFNRGIRYRVTTPGGTAVSPWVTLVVDRTWLISPAEPARSVPVEFVRDLGPVQRPTRATVHQPIGRVDAVRRSTGRRAATKGSAVLALRPDQLPALDELVDTDPTVLLNLHDPSWDVPAVWIAPDGWPTEIAGRRAAGGGAASPYRYLSLSWTVVSQPDVAPLNPWSFDAADDLGWTFDQLDAAFEDFDDFDRNRPAGPTPEPDPDPDPVTATGGYGTDTYGTGAYGT